MSSRSKQTNSYIFQKALVPFSIIGAIIFWQALISFGNIPSFILPAPIIVGQRFIDVLLDGSLFFHTCVTLGEVFSGLILGLFSAVILGYWLAKKPWLERLLSPYIIASQSIPIVAIAPLLVIWLGPGILSKILITALIVFFPILVNIIVGIHAISEDYYDLMKSFQASPWKTLRYLEIPAVMPIFLGGLRIGATLAVIGAVVGEFVGSDRGLGFLINVGRGMYDTALVFVSIFTLVGMAMGIYGVVILIERQTIAWVKRSEKR